MGHGAGMNNGKTAVMVSEGGRRGMCYGTDDSGNRGQGAEA